MSALKSPTTSKKCPLNRNSKNKEKTYKTETRNKARPERIRGADICCYHDCCAALHSLAPV